MARNKTRMWSIAHSLPPRSAQKCVCARIHSVSSGSAPVKFRLFSTLSIRTVSVFEFSEIFFKISRPTIRVENCINFIFLPYNAITGAHIRTVQKYEWLIQFCFFCFVFVCLVQNFLARPLMQKNLFWPALICAPCTILPKSSSID